MTPELWQQVEKILAAALGLPPAERAEFLDQECAESPELRQEVESLLAEDEDDDAEDFLAPPVSSLYPADRPIGEGQRFGSYRVLREIDRGGMGAVCLAVRADEEFEKRVALKVVKRGMDTAEIVRRFRHERQILAQLDHPNIARLLDGGTTDDGLPYFVMEHVCGEPINRYCDARKLSTRARIELFRKVCSAVQFAHRNLVVHRDLKPGNILVTEEGEPKLLDFGIAKLLAPEPRFEAPATAYGHLPMTLEYASPEQVRGEAMTTASDVYSLGVLLYELLTGHRPYRTPSGSREELCREIREDEPVKPSTAVGRTEQIRRSGATTVTLTPERVSEVRDGDPRTLRRRLSGDLDAIVLKALGKDPRRRYASVEQLSEDLRYHLEGLPVMARKPTRTYQVGKLVRRHRLETALAAGVLVLIVGFAVNATVLKNRAERERERAEEVSELLVQLFEATNPDRARGKDVTAREVLDLGREKIEEYRDTQPRLYARLADTMGHVYYNLGLYEEARSLQEEALTSLRQVVGDGADPDLALAINDLAALLYQQGEYQEAEELLRESLDMMVRLHGEADPEVVRTMNNLATVVTQRGDHEEAERLYRRGLAIRQRLVPPVPADVATSFFLLGTLLLEKGHYQEADPPLRQALAMRRELYGSEHTGVATVVNNLGMVRAAVGDAEEAEKLYREALRTRRKLLGEGHSAVASTEANLASLLVAAGSYQEAERLGRHALRSLRDSKPGHWRTAYARSVLGSSLVGLGRYDEAEPLLVESYPVLEEAKSECTRYPLDALRRLIGLYDAWDRPEGTAAYRALAEKCGEPP